MRARSIVALAVALGAVGVGAVIWRETRPAPLPAAPAVAARTDPPPLAPAPSAPESAPAPVAAKRVSDAAPKSSKHWWDGFIPGKRARGEEDDAAKEETGTIAI